MKYLVQFGNFQGPKWVPEFTLERDDLNTARGLVRWAAVEMLGDRDYHLSVNTQIQLWDDGSPPKLYNYITAKMPRPWIPLEH